METLFWGNHGLLLTFWRLVAPCRNSDVSHRERNHPVCLLFDATWSWMVRLWLFVPLACFVRLRSPETRLITTSTHSKRLAYSRSQTRHPPPGRTVTVENIPSQLPELRKPTISHIFNGLKNKTNLATLTVSDWRKKKRNVESRLETQTHTTDLLERCTCLSNWK